MKKYKALISLIISITLLLSAFSGNIALAENETIKVENENGVLVDAIVDSETGDVIIAETEDSEEETEDSEEAEETKEPEEVVQEETNKFPNAKLSGVDFVHVYDGSFETVSDYLRRIGVFKDSDNDPSLVLTRGEFAVIAARILNLHSGNVMPAFRYEFKDVDEASACYDAVNTLCNYGFIEGDGNGYFYPDSELKSAEAVIILMNMLGYYEIAHLRGSGDSGYRNLAVNMKFTKEVPFNYTTTVTLEKAARLIYHALHEKVAESSSYSGNGVTFSQSDETLMCRYLDVYTVEGVVTANEYTSLYSKAGKVNEKSIKINDMVISFVDENLDPQDYLGLYSRVYYKDEAGNKSALYIEAISSKYELLKINAEDIVDFDKVTNTLSYKENKYKENKKVVTEKIGMGIKIIFNSAAVEGNIHEKYFTPDAGQLVFIDNNRDDKYDVLIIDSYSAYVSKGTISNEEGNLHDDLGVHTSLSLAGKNVRVYKNNEKADYSAIASGDVVFVATEKVSYKMTEGINPMEYQTIDPTSEYVKLLASDYKISGTVDSIDDKYVYIDSAGYEYSNGFYIAAAIGLSSKASNTTRLGSVVSGRLNINGDIAWLSKSADENIKYAYVVKAGVGDRASSNHRIMMYTQDDEMVIAEFDDKVKVYKMWGSGEINTNNYYDKTFKGNTIANECPEIGSRQLIKYKLNQDGKVKEIYISVDDFKDPYDDEDVTGRDYYNEIPILQEGIFYYCTEVKTRTTEQANGQISYDDCYYYMSFGNSGIIEPFFYYNKNTSVGFKVPSADSAAEILEDERYYSAYSVTSKGVPFTHAENLINSVKLYDVSNSVVGAVVRERKYSGATDDTTGITFDYQSSFVDAIVDSVYQVRDTETDEFVTEITAWVNGKLTKFKFARKDLVSNEITYSSKFPYFEEVYDETQQKMVKKHPFSRVAPSELMRGDVVMLHQDLFGNVDGFKIAHRPMYTLSKSSESNPFVGYETTFDGIITEDKYQNHIYVGTCVLAAGKVLKMAGSTPIVATDRAALRRMQMYGGSTNVQIIIYDVYQDTMTVSKSSSKNPTFSKCEEGDYIFWYQYERYPETVIVVRNYR